MAGFEVTIMSSVLQEFKTFVKYVLNHKQEFLFEVQAIVEPVKLSLNKHKIKFQFADDNVILFNYSLKWKLLTPSRFLTTAIQLLILDG